ncbi:tape measure protein [Luteimonas sp. FXH3W]|uniref:Tape measure protein n=1 Tax=Aquilutibacter rugosus TaxID=3115820 RepID=A0ABU7UWQ3_9GAMM
MATQDVTLRITANANGVSATVVKVKDDLGSLGGAGKRAGNEIDAGMTRARRGVESISQQLAQTKSQFLQLIGVNLGMQLVKDVARVADEWNSVASRIDLATKGAVSQQAAMRGVYAVAQQTGTQMGITGDLAAKMSTTLIDMGRNSSTAFKQSLDLTRTINQTFAVSGASAEAQKNAITQLTQGLAGGVLRAEEFNSVIENSPRLARALADGMNLSMGELRAAVNSGQVSSEALVAALQNQASVIEAEYNKMPLSIGRAWTMIQNGVMQYIGMVNSSWGASQAIAQSLAFVAQNIGLIANGLLMLGGAWVSTLIGRALPALTTFAQGLIVTTNVTRATTGATLGMSVMQQAAVVTTTRLTVAQVAATVATRALGAAMAFLSSSTGIGLVITGVALLISYLNNMGETAKVSSDEAAASFRTAKQALDEYKNSAGTANFKQLVDANVPQELDKITERLQYLRAEKEKYDNTTWIYESEQGRQAYREMSNEIDVQYERLKQLNPAWAQATQDMAQHILTTAGAKNASADLTAEVARLIDMHERNKISTENYKIRVEAAVRASYDMNTASRAASQGIDEAARAAQNAAASMDFWSGKINGVLVNLARLRAGQKGAMQMEAGLRIRQMAIERGGGKNKPGAYERGRAAMIADGSWQEEGKGILEMNRLLDQQDREQAAADARAKAQRNAASSGAKAARAAAAAAKRDERLNVQRDNKAETAQQQLTNLIEEMNGRNMGPVAKVNADYAKKAADIAKIEKDLASAKRLTAENQQLLTQATEASNAAKERALVVAQREEDENKRKLDIVGNLTEEYDRETKAIGMNAREQMIADAIEKARATAKQQYIDGQRTSIELTEQETAALRGFIGTSYDQRQLAEVSKQAADDFHRNWTGAIDAVGDAWTDFIFSGLRDWKSFGNSLKDIARQFMGNVMRQMRQSGGQGGVAQQLQQLIWGNAQPASGFASGGSSIGSMFTGAIDKLSASNNSMLSGLGNLFGRMFGGSAAAGSSVAIGQSAGMIAPVATAMPRATISPWMGAMAGGMWGLQRGGDGLMGKAGSMSAGLIGGIYAAKGVSAAVSAFSAGGGLMGAATSALKAIPVAGWIALGAIAVDKISGGKLFGTSYKKESTATGFNITGTGADGFTSVTESKQKALFGGKKYRTTTTGLDAEAEAQVDSMFKALSKSIADAAAQLNVDMPAMIAASYKSEYDKDGKLTRQGGTINGRNYNESQEAFVARLVGENLLAVAKGAGSSAEIEQLAEAYRSTGEELQAFSAFMLAVQSDLKNGTNLWNASQVSLTRLTEVVESLGKAGETVAETYGRIVSVANEYGTLIAGIDTQLRTAGLSDYQRQALEIETAYRSQIKQANALAKSVGLAGARTEDLAKVEMLRAVSMAKLQQQMEAQRDSFLQDLQLSNLSPLRDDQKLAEAMGQFRTAVATGDLARAQQLSNTALQLGQTLFASGADYNALYNEITESLKGIQTPSLILDDGTTMGDLAQLLMDLPHQFASEFASLIYTPAAPVVSAPILAPSVGTPLVDSGKSDAVQQQQLEALNTLVDLTTRTQRMTRAEQILT